MHIHKETMVHLNVLAWQFCYVKVAVLSFVHVSVWACAHLQNLFINLCEL